MAVVIDTSALVALERGGAWDQLEQLDEPALLPAIVVAELLVGAQMADTLARTQQRRRRIDALCAVVPVVDFTRETAVHWADVFAQLSTRGTMIPSNDLAVAATARQLDAGVLVGPGDEQHFRRVEGLVVHVLGAR